MYGNKRSASRLKPSTTKVFMLNAREIFSSRAIFRRALLRYNRALHDFEKMTF